MRMADCRIKINTIQSVSICCIHQYSVCEICWIVARPMTITKTHHFACDVVGNWKFRFDSQSKRIAKQFLHHSNRLDQFHAAITNLGERHGHSRGNGHRKDSPSSWMQFWNNREWVTGLWFKFNGCDGCARVLVWISAEKGVFGGGGQTQMVTGKVPTNPLLHGGSLVRTKRTQITQN